MSNKKLKYRSIISQINYWSLLLFVFWLPLKDDFLPTILALWIFTWLLEGNFKNRLNQFPQKKYYLGFLVYFLLTLLFVFRAKDINDGFFHVQEKLSMIFFPLFFWGSNQKAKANQTTILKVFVLSNLLVSIYYLTNAFLNSLIFENGSYSFIHAVNPYFKNYSFFEVIKLRDSYFTYTHLSVFKHPSYSSMYITFAILIIVDLLRKGFVLKKWSKVGTIALILFFSSMLFLLQSRAAIITFGTVILLVPLIELRKKLKKRFISLTFGLFFVSLAIIVSNNRIRQNISEVIQLTKHLNHESLTNTDLRFQLWYTSLHIIKQNFWLGASPANVKTELVKKYKELGFNKAAEDQLNSHNQYLETIAGLGILGLITLIYIIAYTFMISIKQKQYLLFFLMLILAINFLFESMLNRMSGILFMMFFISLFVFNNRPIRTTVLNKTTDY